MSTLQQREKWIIGASMLLLLTLLLCIIATYSATARPGGIPRWFHAPPIGRHMISLGVLPCTAITPGQLVLGYNVLLRSSILNPPGWALPTAPPCP